MSCDFAPSNVKESICIYVGIFSAGLMVLHPQANKMAKTGTKKYLNDVKILDMATLS